MTGKVYITPEGVRTLRDELNYLWRVKRPDVTQIVSEAAALGDRSENADYIYGKKHLREIDKRIRYLTKRLDNLEIVDRKPDDREKIFFGAWMKLKDDQGVISQLRIVGADEFDLKKGWISLESPMARSLIGKSKGDDVIVRRPMGDIEMTILDVSYDPWDE
jgi:transcription elongation factor GreB